MNTAKLLEMMKVVVTASIQEPHRFWVINQVHLALTKYSQDEVCNFFNFLDWCESNAVIRRSFGGSSTACGSLLYMPEDKLNALMVIFLMGGSLFGDDDG